MTITLSLKKIMTYIIMLFIILNCRSLIASLMGLNNLIAIGTFLFVPAIVANLGSPGRRNIKANNLLIKTYIFYLFSMFILFVIGDFKYIQFVFVQIIAVSLAIIWFTSGDIEVNREKAMEAFTNIVYVMCVISLFFFTMGTVLGVLKPTIVYSAQRIGWGSFDYRVYFYLYTDGQRTGNFLFSGLRNIGIFLEAPMFAYVLIIALYYELFLGKCKPLKVVIMLLTAFTTISTSAISFAVILTTIKFWKIIRKNKFLLYFVFPLALLLCFASIYYLAYDKFVRFNGSGVSRADTLGAAWKSFLHSPIIGNGYINSRALDPYRRSFALGVNREIYSTSREAGLSTGLFGILSNGGILWGGFYIVPLVFSVKKMWKSRKSEIDSEFCWLMFNVVIFVLLIITVVYYTTTGPFMNVLCWVNLACTTASRAKDKRMKSIEHI